MSGYRPYTDFTAQGLNVRALMGLYAALEKSDEKHPNLSPFIVFIAFSIESYLNSLGARKIVYWNELEKLPWRNKVEILHKVAGQTPDWGKEPLQFAAEVFRLRDKLAHGKPEREIGPVTSDIRATDGFRSGQIVPAWYRSITKEWVLEAKGRFTKLMVYLGGLFNLHESDHLHLSSSGMLPPE